MRSAYSLIVTVLPVVAVNVSFRQRLPARVRQSRFGQLFEDHGTRQCGKGGIGTDVDQHGLRTGPGKTVAGQTFLKRLRRRADMVAKAATVRRRPCSRTGQDVCFIEPPLPILPIGLADVEVRRLASNEATCVLALEHVNNRVES